MFSRRAPLLPAKGRACATSTAGLLFLLPLLAAAASDGKALAELSLSPASCMQRDAAEPCVERIVVRWQVHAVQPICLWLRGASAPLFCAGQAQGERELNLSVRQSLQFELLGEKSGELLARSELLVVAGPAPAKRRRYQHPWSIF